jgi:hypothetical protein
MSEVEPITKTIKPKPLLGSGIERLTNPTTPGDALKTHNAHQRNVRSLDRVADGAHPRLTGN